MRKKELILMPIGFFLIIMAIMLLSRLFWRESPNITLWRKDADRIVKIEVEDYLIGVVLAEMPASFHSEALKAQAVCARTYLFKRYFAKSNHANGAVVCDDPTHCQAYLSPDEFRLKNQGNTWMIKKIGLAVKETRGQVIVWQGKLIDSLYHSTCGGHTEDAQAVWGRAVPYLIGVECPWDRKSPKREQTMVLTHSDFRSALTLSRNTRLNPSQERISDHGTVQSISWDNKVFSGSELRNRIGLPSSAFTITVNDSTVEITSRGCGHRVGLCQYGADGMARSGADYQGIIHYYYSGVKIIRIVY